MCNILLDYNEKGDRSMNSNVEKLEQLYSLLNVIQHMLEMPNSDIFNKVYLKYLLKEKGYRR